jgi:hypothetical protein
MPSKADLVYQARSGDCRALQGQEIVDSYVLYGATAVTRRVMQLSHRTNAPEWLCTAGHEHFIPAHAFGVHVGPSSSLPMPRRVLDSKCWARQSFYALHFQRSWAVRSRSQRQESWRTMKLLSTRGEGHGFFGNRDYRHPRPR